MCYGVWVYNVRTEWVWFETNWYLLSCYGPHGKSKSIVSYTEWKTRGRPTQTYLFISPSVSVCYLICCLCRYITGIFNSFITKRIMDLVLIRFPFVRKLILFRKCQQPLSFCYCYLLLEQSWNTIINYIPPFLSYAHIVFWCIRLKIHRYV